MKKRVLALLMAAALTLGICVPAFGANVTNETSGHTYVAYQVFSGTQADGDDKLGDVEWGDGVNGDGLFEELKEDYAYFDACTSAAEVAKVLDGKADNCSEAKALAATATRYLKGDGTAIAAGASVDLAAGYWLIVDKTSPVDERDARNAALLQVTNKGDIAITKKYDVPSVDKTVDKTDANIGDTVIFTLTATMPSTLEGYETYNVVFHDTLSEGLAYAGNLKVLIDGTDKTTGFTLSCEGTLLTVSCDDVKVLGAKESSKIVVTYDAVLDDDAVIGASGNPNKVKLEYSNDPNWNGEGTEPTGNTPEIEVKVFTWEIPVVKVDGSDHSKKLAGAKFTLFKDANCSQSVDIVEPSEGAVYKVCTQGNCTDHAHVSEIVTDSTGEFEIEGLQQGTYYLKEIEAPAGYNLLPKALKVVVGENGILTVDDSTSTVAKVTVENNKGPVLPETGGIGTTLFYVVGGALVIGAAVLLVVRRRAAGSEE